MKTNEAIAALASLAQETRLGIFRLLVRRGPEGLPAGQIAERLGIPANTLSFHLSHLSHAGLIQSRREGRVIHYELRAEGIRALMGFLMEDCCQDRPDLCGPGPSESACCPPAPRGRPAVRKVRVVAGKGKAKP